MLLQSSPIKVMAHQSCWSVRGLGIRDRKKEKEQKAA